MIVQPLPLPQQVWKQVSSGLHAQMGSMFDRYFRDAYVQFSEDGVFTLSIADDLNRQWVANRWANRLTRDFQQAAGTQGMKFERLEFVTAPPAPPVKKARPIPIPTVSTQLALPAPATTQPQVSDGLEVQVSGTTSPALLARIKWATVLEVWREQDPALLARLKGAPLGVWHALTSYVNQEGLCHPATETLALDTGYSRPVILKALDLLVTEGLISKTRRKYSSTQYQLREPGESKESLLSQTEGVSPDQKVKKVDSLEVEKVKKIDSKNPESKDSLPKLSSSNTTLPEKERTTTSLVRVKKVDFLEWEPVHKELAAEGFTRNEITRMIAGALKHGTTVEAATEWVLAYQTTLKGKVTKGYLHSAFVNGWKIRPEQRPPDMRAGASYLEPEYAHIVEH